MPKQSFLSFNLNKLLSLISTYIQEWHYGVVFDDVGLITAINVISYSAHLKYGWTELEIESVYQTQSYLITLLA